MIRQILKNHGSSKRQLYKNKYVCGCIYRSFNDLESAVFFRFCINNGRLNKQAIADMAATDKIDGNLNVKRLMDIVECLQSLEIVKSFDNNNFQLQLDFSRNVEQFLKNQKQMQTVKLQNKPKPYQPEPYEFLQILLTNKMPRNCKIPGLSQYAHFLTREQFMYIKSDISFKIGVLIQGIINSRDGQSVQNIQTIVMLNLLDSQEYYLKTPKLSAVVDELAKIKLVQLAGNRGEYFRISKYLQHFTFQSSKQKKINTKLNCKIIIETNFKVFAVIQPKSSERQANVIKKILSMLLHSKNQGVVYQELFIGQIQETFMKQQIFKDTNILAQQYFQFFRQYTNEQHNEAKDLGKWKKLKFIGLEGPSQQSNIPNNIKQEVKLWQHLKNVPNNQQND